MFSQAAVERAIEDMTAAGRAGFETPGLQLSLGAMQFHRSVLADNPSAMEASVAATRRGLELAGRLRDDAGRPHVNTVIAEANLGLSLLALDRADEAAAAYDEMIADTGRLGSFWHQQLASSALTTLGILAEERPDLGSRVTAMKEQIVRGVFGTGQPATGEPATASVTATTAEIFPSVVQWRATIPAFDPAGDRLVTQWYRRDAVPNARWYALPLVSGLLELDRVAAGGGFFRDTGPDAYWGNSDAPLRDVIPSCLGPAEYRLELYLNGRLAGNATAAVAQEPLTAHLSRDVGVAVCAPASWTATSAVPGVSTGIRSEDESRGLLVFRTHQPLEPPADPRQTAIERVLRERGDLLPASLGSGQEIDPVTQPTVFGRNTNLWQRHAYPDGSAKLVATQSANGSGTILVAVIYGPDDWVDSIDAGRIAISLLEY